MRLNALKFNTQSRYQIFLEIYAWLNRNLDDRNIIFFEYVVRLIFIINVESL